MKEPSGLYYWDGRFKFVEADISVNSDLGVSRLISPPVIYFIYHYRNALKHRVNGETTNQMRDSNSP